MPLVYLIDERVSNSRALLDNVPEVDLPFLITSYMPVAEIVSTVVKGLAAPPPRSAGLHRDTPAAPMITALRIMAGGDSSELQLGRGIDVRNAAQLAPLGACLRAGASGECLLLGCNVATGAPLAERFLGGAARGERIGAPGGASSVADPGSLESAGFPLLRALARTLGVPVTAALDAQSTARDWHFAGATVTVDPFGHVTYAGMDTPVRVSF